VQKMTTRPTSAQGGAMLSTKRTARKTKSLKRSRVAPPQFGGMGKGNVVYAKFGRVMGPRYVCSRFGLRQNVPNTSASALAARVAVQSSVWIRGSLDVLW